MSAGTKTGNLPLDNLRAANQTLLRQGLTLLSQLDDESYVKTVEPIFSFGVGCHIRHCLDAYACFLRGAAVGWIDYDARVRDERIESDRGYALIQLKTMIEMIDSLQRLSSAEMNSNLQARQDGTSWADTSPAREWQYLLSHTVHHYALIAVILRVQGYSLSPHFGVAPSTLAFWGKPDSGEMCGELELVCAR